MKYVLSMNMRFALYLIPFFALLFGCSEKQSAYFSDQNGAIRGYDPVAYFTAGKPVKGQKDIKTEWQGVDWYFSTVENQALFESSPEKYAPQFGGFCALGVAKGTLVKIEPEAWDIVEGKLYLNYDLEYRKEWMKNTSSYILQANKNWPGLSH